MAFLVRGKENYYTWKKFLTDNQYDFTIKYADIGWIFVIKK